METGNEKIDQLLRHAEEYAGTRKRLVKLIVTEKAGSVFASVAAAFVLFFIFFFVVVFASLTLAWAVSAWFGNPYAGFIAVTALYLVAGLLLAANRERWLKGPLQSMFIRGALKNDNDE